jgi:hypothetical protein
MRSLDAQEAGVERREEVIQTRLTKHTSSVPTFKNCDERLRRACYFCAHSLLHHILHSVWSGPFQRLKTYNIFRSAILYRAISEMARRCLEHIQLLL